MKRLTSLKLVSTALTVLFAGCAAEIDGGSDPFAPKDQAELVATITQRSCGSDAVLERQLIEDPGLEERMADIEAQTEVTIETRSMNGSTVVVPVVVHVVYHNAAENISDAQIQSQIDVLNRDFRRTNTDANSTWAQAADANIEFRLMGISRTSTTKASFGTDDSIKFASSGGHDVYQPSKYLNLWVGTIGGGILGYAQFPGGGASTDGVVISPEYFGTTGTVVAPFNLGRTATHEVGHWLNLRHIWGDNSQCGTGTTAGDLVSDTPAARAPNYGCPNVDSCTGDSRDMVENYMDYSDDSCMNLFTTGQKARMQALFSAGGARESLTTAPLTPVDFGGGTTPPPASNYSVVETRTAQAAATGAQTTYGPYNAAGRTAIKFEISGGTGDADLYVKFGSAPTTSSYDCRPYVNGNTEVCEFNPSQSGNYFVMVHAYAGYSNVTFKVSAIGGSTTTPEICTDAVDNDGDGKVDCADTDCSAAAACQPVNNPEICGDGLDNDSDGATDCNDSDCAALPACTPTGGATIVSSENFSTGFGAYTDGGANARSLTDTTRCFSNGKCVELRGNTSSSVVTTNSLNLSSYNSIQIDFNFYNTDFETGERLIVEVSTNGTNWTSVANFVKGSNGFGNGGFGGSIPVSRSTVAFSSTTKVRFRSQASSTSTDNVYIDDVVISAQ